MAKKSENPPKVLREVANWKNLYFYQKADTLFQITHVFCDRFLPAYGDRTVDQMIQAARSGKQNIVEGSEDGKTSTEMELKLLNVARASIKELLEDYQDYLNSRHLATWSSDDPRYKAMQAFATTHNSPEAYLQLAQQWSAEEFCNTALTLCHQANALINGYLDKLERDFVTQGGIKERMYAARTGYRQEQDAKMKSLEAENADLRNQIAQQQAAYDDLRQRALRAYNALKEENQNLRQEIESLKHRTP